MPSYKFYVFILILFIVDILLIKFYKNIIGFFGELYVKLELKKLNKNYLIINNLMFKTKDNNTHQIDHLVISPYGIFVIETKQYNGYIKGNEYDLTWKVKAGNKTFNINNPIHQNYGHIKSLEEILNINEDKFINIVCIPSNANVKVNSSSVTRINTLIPKILSYNDIIIDNINDIYINLNKLNIKDKCIRKEHNQYAKNIKQTKESFLKNKCPKCGGELVKRTSKYGEFLGCSNYPKCKYINK